MQCGHCSADPVQQCGMKFNLYNTTWAEIQDGHACKHVFGCNYADIGIRILCGVLRITTCENREIALTLNLFSILSRASSS
jgi:hypothetical protein